MKKIFLLLIPLLPFIVQAQTVKELVENNFEIRAASWMMYSERPYLYGTLELKNGSFSFTPSDLFSDGPDEENRLYPPFLYAHPTGTYTIDWNDGIDPETPFVKRQNQIMKLGRISFFDSGTCFVSYQIEYKDCPSEEFRQILSDCELLRFTEIQDEFVFWEIFNSDL